MSIGTSNTEIINSLGKTINSYKAILQIFFLHHLTRIPIVWPSFLLISFRQNSHSLRDPYRGKFN